MMYHDSQDIYYRKPFGAVRCREQIQLRLSAPKAEKCTLRLWDGKETLIPMGKESAGVFSVNFTAPDEPCLLWYCFIAETKEGIKYYCNNADGLGGTGRTLDGMENSYQITVYNERKVPEWFKNGMIYQIFPDRFMRGSDFRERVSAHESRRTTLPRVIVTDEDDKPFYIKNSKGEVIRWPFYGGTLTGIKEKLGYLKELGVTILYLNPIFEASSSHRYDTADFMHIDPVLGDEESFHELIETADSMGMHVILDGVFSHVGRDSVYFDYFNTFGTGVSSDPDSAYKDWFKKDEKGEYSYWWGVKDLPNADKTSESYRRFIYGGNDSVVKHWLKKGIKGWRLDVADELPDDFIKGIRSAMDEVDPDSVLIGEVWEDASNKISYGKLRSYFAGDELDSTMNYPLRLAYLGFLNSETDAVSLSRRIMSLSENYPPENFRSAMNLIGSHDRERILTLLNGDKDKLRLMFELQMLSPGVPSVYYGDEAGMTGGADPENRASFPWKNIDKTVLDSFKFAAKIRRDYDVLKNGSFRCKAISPYIYSQVTDGKDDSMLYYINLGEGTEVDISEYLTPASRAIELHSGKVLAGNKVFIGRNASLIIYVIKDFKSFDYGKKKGILCHVTSLPGKYGCGTLGADGKRFADWLSDNGYDLWQVLPLTLTGDGDSPYYSPSVFAGNQLLIDPEGLFADGLISKAELKSAELEVSNGRIDYEALKEKRSALLKSAFKRFKPTPDYEKFVSENSYWLKDHALFMALRERFSGRPWTDWPVDARERRFSQSDVNTLINSKAARFECFQQYIFEKQLSELKSYANSKGVSLFGDLPIYVAHDSADVWANRDIFDLDKNGFPNSAAGVPPDYFEEDGQYWGNPLYLWEKPECTEWWEKRLARAFSTLDFVRLDHFRGFEAYWEIPKGTRSGKKGVWKKGPGEKFFRKMEEHFGKLPIIAEDLGLITPEVNALRNRLGFPGMYTYQFSKDYMFSDPVDEASRVFYTGTHDNDTLIGWLSENGFDAASAEKEAGEIMERLRNSDAPWCVFPIQDILKLGSSARMNVPGTVGNNWNFSCTEEQLYK